MKNFKTAQAVLEYSLLIAVIVGAAIAMQVYIKRSMQGQIQLSGDQVGDQYVVADTKNHELYRSEASVTELTAPGWGHPTTVTGVSGSYSSEKERQLHMW
ncbi:MAG: hypothetical protein WC412_07695 [Candidatus Omnitrophota bacterium]|jgi:uncharacterized protein (UPF0333 family)